MKREQQREKLIITGSVRDHDKAYASWQLKAAGTGEKLSPYDMMQASSYLDWIGPAAIRHRSDGAIAKDYSANKDSNAANKDEPLLEIRFWGTGASRLEKDIPEAAESIREWLCDTQGQKMAGQEAHAVNTSGSEEQDAQLVKSDIRDLGPERPDGNDARSPKPEVFAALPPDSEGQYAQSVNSGRKETDRKETDQKETGRKETDRKETDQKETGRKETDRKETDQKETGRIIEALEWIYPYQKLTTVPAKISVTELKRRSMQEEANESAVPFIQPMQERPLFMEPDKDLSAAHKGTEMHFVMQHLDLGKLNKAVAEAKTVAEASTKAVSAKATTPTAPSASTTAPTAPSAPSGSISQGRSGMDQHDILVQEIRLQMSSMKDKELLTPAEIESVKPDSVAAFFGSSVGKHMLTMYESVHRETAFTIEIKCQEVSKDLEDSRTCDEMMLLQGVIDCWFETEDGLVLLDYKTDYVPFGRPEIIRERYRVQIDYYTKTLEKITGKKVTKRYLYLFYSGELLVC